MFELPPDFQWFAPWSPIADELHALEFGGVQSELESGESIADTLVAELKREVPSGHVLKNCRVCVIAQCSADPNEFLFTTDLKNGPLAMVHLTWRTETDPLLPYTVMYGTIDDWTAQMKKEYIGHSRQPPGNGG